MIEKIFNHIDDKLSNFEQIHLRFELGEPFENGTNERINQVIYRVVSLFQDFFNPEDEVYLLIKDWESDDPMFVDATPNYIYEIINNLPITSDTFYEKVEDGDDDEPIRVKRSLTTAKIKDIDYHSILEGIANYEQGREPSIGQRVYFLNYKNGNLFYMYDDRGCLLFSDSTEQLRHLYQKYSSWIVDYWRGIINSFFRK